MILFTATLSLAQDLGTLRGFVTDSLSAEALVYATAYVKEVNRGANTDVRGYFVIPSLPADRNLTLIISYVGYRTKVIPIRLAKEKVTHFNIPMEPSGIQMKTIERVGERYKDENSTSISMQRIGARELESIPKGVETDVFRGIKYLPGVQSTGDVSAQYYVRGGASNQNLVLIDGLTIYNPFHALGLFSVVDPDMINNIEFYKGGFAAEFGGRLSSVMSIITKDGNKNSFGAKASASFLTAKVLLEGPLPNGSFIFTGRKSYSSQIIKKFLNEQNVPIDFGDFSFKANFSDDDFIKGAKFYVNGFFSNDNITHTDPRIEDYSWNNKVFGFKWFQVGDSPLFYEISLSISKFQGQIDPKLSSARQTSNSVSDGGIQMNVNYIFDNKDEISVGYHIRQISTSLFLQNDQNANIDLGSSGANISFYAKYRFLQFDNLGVDIGTRFTLASLVKNKKADLMEPRLNFHLRVLPGITIKGAAGIYQQEMTTVSDENEVINIFEPWIISPEYLKPAKAIHYVLGVDTQIWEQFAFNVEGYYKKVNDLPVINENKILNSDRDFIAGEGESYGLEIFSRINPGPINFTAAYTLAYAYKKINGDLYYPRYDVRHTVNLGLEINLGAGWSTSLMWIYNTGLPFTLMEGYYDKYYFQNIYTPWNQLDPRQPYTLIGIQNLGRLPDYHRMDFSISKTFKFDFAKINMDFSIINVYDRKNIFYFKRDTGERVNMLPFLPTATVKVEL